MDSDVGNLIAKIANLPDGSQVQVFRSISCFPAISMPVLEMTGNELERVFISSCTTPLGEPGPLAEDGGGWGVSTRAKNKSKIVETDTEDDQDEHDDDETSEDEPEKLKSRKVSI